MQVPLDQLKRGLVRHSGPPADLWGQTIPTEPHKGGHVLEEVAATDAGDLADPPELFEVVNQC